MAIEYINLLEKREPNIVAHLEFAGWMIEFLPLKPFS